MEKINTINTSKWNESVKRSTLEVFQKAYLENSGCYTYESYRSLLYSFNSFVFRIFSQ